MFRRVLAFGVALIVTCAFANSALAQGCSFPNGANSTLDELLQAIESEPLCGLPWPALKRIASDRAAADQLKAAYLSAIAASPAKAAFAKELALLVDAAAGEPGALLAFYDGNVKAHPDDNTRPNASCWVRAITGFDVKGAMPFCHLAVAAGRPAHSLVNRAMIELQLGAYAAALADFEEALADPSIKGHPFAARAKYGRGIARLRSNDLGGAKDIRKAEKLQPSVTADFEAVGLTP